MEARMPVRAATTLVFVTLALLVLGIREARTQGQTGSIAGVVRDTSGAVLPGVTVEAASPALIRLAPLRSVPARREKS
jgi:hypothetical protein